MKRHTKHTKHEIIEDLASKAITATIIATLYCAIFVNPLCLFAGLIVCLFISSSFLGDDSTYPSESCM